MGMANPVARIVPDPEQIASICYTSVSYTCFEHLQPAHILPSGDYECAKRSAMETLHTLLHDHSHSVSGVVLKHKYFAVAVQCNVWGMYLEDALLLSYLPLGHIYEVLWLLWGSLRLLMTFSSGWLNFA